MNLFNLNPADVFKDASSDESQPTPESVSTSTPKRELDVNLLRALLKLKLHPKSVQISSLEQGFVAKYMHITEFQFRARLTELNIDLFSNPGDADA